MGYFAGFFQKFFHSANPQQFRNLIPLGHQGEVIPGDDPQHQNQNAVDHAADHNGPRHGQGVAQVGGQQAIAGPHRQPPSPRRQWRASQRPARYLGGVGGNLFNGHQLHHRHQRETHQGPHGRSLDAHRGNLHQDKVHRQLGGAANGDKPDRQGRRPLAWRMALHSSIMHTKAEAMPSTSRQWLATSWLVSG